MFVSSLPLDWSNNVFQVNFHFANKQQKTKMYCTTPTTFLPYIDRIARTRESILESMWGSKWSHPLAANPLQRFGGRYLVHVEEREEFLDFFRPDQVLIGYVPVRAGHLILHLIHSGRSGSDPNAARLMETHRLQKGEVGVRDVHRPTHQAFVRTSKESSPVQFQPPGTRIV